MLWSPLTNELERRGCKLAHLFALALLALPLGGCDTLSSFWNKDEPALDEPAEKLYNEGLYNLNAKGDVKKPPPSGLRSTASTPIPNGRASR